MGLQPKKQIIFAYISMLLLFFSPLGCNREHPRQTEPNKPVSVLSNAPQSSFVPSLKQVRIRTGTDASRLSHRPVIAVHGLGDTAQHFSSLFNNAPFCATVIFPQAPTRHGQGFSWFPVAIPVRRAALPTLQKDVTTATETMCEFIRAAHFRYKPIVTGFSQGGILAFSTAVSCPSLIHAAIPVAGFLPFTLPKQTTDIPPILAFHGTDDKIIEIDKARESIRQFVKRGFRAKLTEFPGLGHTISLQLQEELMFTIRKHL